MNTTFVEMKVAQCVVWSMRGVVCTLNVYILE